ncbi:MAG: ferric reductase-like transmembrane domain-containing protein [Betaproteobacteria bacterium]
MTRSTGRWTAPWEPGELSRDRRLSDPTGVQYPVRVGQPTPARPTSELRPPARGGGGRRLLTVLFWAGLAISLAVWWMGTPASSVDSVGAALNEAGRITGMVAGYTLLIQILLMSRVGWLDRIVSANDLVLLHRDLGGLLVVAVLTHMATLIVGYAKLDEISLWAETTTMLSRLPDMISTFVATGLLVGVGLLAIRSVRSRLPYEVWYRLHLVSYGVLLFGYGHQFAAGRDLSNPGIARSYWLGLYAFVLACLAWGRIVSLVRLNLRHRLRVAEIVLEGADMFSIYVRGRRLDELNARAGQYFRWRFLARGCWTQAHPFSLSAAPNERWLRLTVKAVGQHTERLRRLRPGVRVIASGPSGAFTAARRQRHRALLIAGGSGIAPIRALLEDLPRGTVVVYRASTPDDVVFQEELTWLARDREAEIHYVIGSRDDPGPRRVMTPKGMRRLVPDVNRRDVYLCGPEGLVTAAVKLLRRLHVPRKQIHLDPFEF